MHTLYMRSCWKLDQQVLGLELTSGPFCLTVVDEVWEVEPES